MRKGALKAIRADNHVRLAWILPWWKKSNGLVKFPLCYILHICDVCAKNKFGVALYRLVSVQENNSVQKFTFKMSGIRSAFKRSLTDFVQSSVQKLSSVQILKYQVFFI